MSVSVLVRAATMNALHTPMVTMAMLHVVLVILQMTLLAKSQVASPRNREEVSVAARPEQEKEEEEVEVEEEQFLSHRSSLQSDCVFSFALSLSFFHPLHPSGHTVAGAFYSRSVP